MIKENKYWILAYAVVLLATLAVSTQLFFGACLLLVSVLFYFWPTLIAWKNDHVNTTGIFVINLFFGWTLIGWGIAWYLLVRK
jgi:hypothetical protein